MNCVSSSVDQYLLHLHPTVPSYSAGLMVQTGCILAAEVETYISYMLEEEEEEEVLS